MTVKEKLHELFTTHGLSPNEADIVILSISAKDFGSERLKEAFNKTWEGYPVQFHAIVWKTAKQFAVKWIDANAPQHLARAVFVGDTQ